MSAEADPLPTFHSLNDYRLKAVSTYERSETDYSVYETSQNTLIFVSGIGRMRLVLVGLMC